jgi:hypothetical protein
MYDKYSFVLEWSDIPYAIQDQKIEEYIEKNWNNCEYLDAKGNIRPLEEVIDDHDIWHEAENQIEAHFPIYF